MILAVVSTWAGELRLVSAARTSPTHGRLQAQEKHSDEQPSPHRSRGWQVGAAPSTAGSSTNPNTSTATGQQSGGRLLELHHRG